MGNNSTASDVFINSEGFNYYEDMVGINYLYITVKVNLTPGEANFYWFNKGLNYVISNHVDALYLTIKKFFIVFGSNENPESSSIDYDSFRENYSDVLNLPLISSYTLVILSIVGTIFSLKEKKRFSLLYVFITLIIFGLSINCVSGRRRMIIAPAIITLSSYAIYEFIGIVRSGMPLQSHLLSGNFKKLIIPIIVVLFFVFFQSFQIPRYTFHRYMAYSDLGEYFTQVRKYDIAIESYKKTLLFREHYETHLHLGDLYFLSKLNADAIRSTKKH